MNHAETLYTIDEVAQFFKCSPSTVWRWVANGVLPRPKKIGGSSRWTGTDLRKTVNAAQRNNNDPNCYSEPKRRKLRRPKGSQK